MDISGFLTCFHSEVASVVCWSLFFTRKKKQGSKFNEFPFKPKLKRKGAEFLRIYWKQLWFLKYFAVPKIQSDGVQLQGSSESTVSDRKDNIPASVLSFSKRKIHSTSRISSYFSHLFSSHSLLLYHPRSHIFGMLCLWPLLCFISDLKIGAGSTVALTVSHSAEKCTSWVRVCKCKCVYSACMLFRDGLVHTIWLCPSKCKDKGRYWKCSHFNDWYTIAGFQNCR